MTRRDMANLVFGALVVISSITAAVAFMGDLPLLGVGMSLNSFYLVGQMD